MHDLVDVRYVLNMNEGKHGREPWSWIIFHKKMDLALKVRDR